MPYNFVTARKLLDDASSKAMNVLEEAERAARGGSFETAETLAEIGAAYGRVAQAAGEALGDVQ